VTVLNTPYWNNAPGRTFDVAPDGKRFLMVKDAADRSAAEDRQDIVVVLNWFRELRQRVPVP
jgi:hypothetical protein